MAKALKAVGTAIAVVGLVATGVGAAAGLALGLGSVTTSVAIGSFAVSASTLMTVGSLVASVGGALDQPEVSSGGAVVWTANPSPPLNFAAGRIGVAGSIVHKDAFGPNDRMYWGGVTVVSAAGPIDAWETFKANDTAMSFDGSGKATTEPYANEMWLRRQNGAQPETTALLSPSGLESGATLSNWGTSYKLSAKAAFMLTLSENSKGSAYGGQQPEILNVIRGLKVYDPRLDSTYPGGSGAHRLNNPATWTYSANPILWALKWQLGLWESATGKGAPQVGYQVGGVGARWETIDVPAFVEAANIADTHGWTVAAWPSTDEDKAQVLSAFLQAGGAYYIEKAGKASCLHRAAARASVATITAADTAGPIELDTGASYLARKNAGVPTYLSEAAGWKPIALGTVTSSAWLTEDGGRERSIPVTYSYVSDPTQAAQLMCLGVAHTREGISGRIPLKPYMQGIEPGDAFTITEAEFVLNGLKCLCLETSYDTTTGVHTVTFVSESDGKYDYAFGLTPDPPTLPSLEPVDPTLVTGPGFGDWTVVVRPPAPDGTSQPGFDLTGGVGNSTATGVLVEFGPSSTGPWTQAYEGPPTVTTVPINGLQPGETYYVAVSYRRDQNYSQRQVYGPYVAPALIAGGAGGMTAEELQEGFRDMVEAFRRTAASLRRVQAYTEARTWLEGQTIGTYVSRRFETISTNLEQLATEITLIGARTESSEASFFESIVALAGENEALAESITELNATVGDQAASIGTIQQVLAGPGGASALIGFYTDVNGYIAGDYSFNDGTTATRAFLTDVFAVVTPGETPVVPFQIVGGVNYLKDTMIDGDLVVSGSIKSGAHEVNSINELDAVFTATLITLGGTGWTTLQTVVTDVKGANTPVLIRFNALLDLRHDAGGSFTSTLELRRRDVGSGGTGTLIHTLTLDATGTTNDSVYGMFPIDVTDVPGEAEVEYFVRLSSTTSDFTHQRASARFMSANQFKTSQV